MSMLEGSEVIIDHSVRAVHFMPYANGIPNLSETSVTDQHWSVRKQKAGVQE